MIEEIEEVPEDNLAGVRAERINNKRPQAVASDRPAPISWPLAGDRWWAGHRRRSQAAWQATAGEVGEDRHWQASSFSDR